ncbi:MAG TPA: ABC transporter permease subunit [Acidimicrobiia bacterium]
MLIADTLRARRLAAVVWIVVGAAFMLVIGYGYVEEVETYPGGAPGIGAALEAAAQAMRLLRWPAERLDTFGGYITYHNLTVVALALGIWGASQGASLLRGPKAEGQLEYVLSTGYGRRRVFASRVAGFVIILLFVTTGIGMGLAVATAVAGALDLSGSMIAMASAGLAALACFGLGLVTGQLAGSARFAAGVTSAAVTGMYLLTNVWEELGWVGSLRYLSPFYYSNQSRVLVPGQSLDLTAMIVLFGMAVGAVGIAVWAFQRRDLRAPLGRLRARAGAAPRPYRVASRSYWWSESSHHRVGLVAWSLGAALITGLMAWLEPVVVEVWEESGFSEFLSAADSGASVADQYLSFASQLVAAVVAAYTISQTAGWLAEMRDGRVELFLSHPISWEILILLRLAVASAGVLAISTAAAVGLSLGAAAVDAPLNLIGLLRTIPITLVLGLAILGLGAMLVAWMPTSTSVILLSAVTFASYLLAFVIPLFDLPDWTMNVSLFGAYGQPYLELPDAGGLLLLTLLALAGGVVAPWVAERHPKVA